MLQLVLVGVLATFTLSGCAFFAAEPEPKPQPQIPEPSTPPLSFEGFNAGDVISDEVFYNYKTMNEEEIRSFINQVGYGCRDGLAPCLQNWRGELPAFPADRFCPGSVSGKENADAASIIYESSQACRVNPQVLLVLLQKEQGLLTASSGRLVEGRYRAATGYACPDGSSCDKQFEGLPRQIYAAARQFQRYRLAPGPYRYHPGGTYDIKFAPNAECGTQSVTISNQATANLYNYTPYVANSAALRGIQDDCATPAQTYFYAYFQAWFGPTH